jgi:hypothetical protein
MAETELFTVRASADLVAEATRNAKAHTGRLEIGRGQLARAGLLAIARGCITDDDLDECLELARLQGGWPRRGERTR